MWPTSFMADMKASMADLGVRPERAEACDVPVRWACRTGGCHTCESGLVSGQVAYDPQPLDLPATGNLLICYSRPVGDVVVDL
jgi:ferredoxin